MTKSATAVKPVKAWGWQSPRGKVYWETYASKEEAYESATYNFGGEGFSVIRVWVQPVK